MSDAAARRRQLESVVYAALARPAAERSAFLAGVCDSDSDLQREAAWLIHMEERAEAFLSGTPLEALAASVMASARGGAVLSSGQMLGHYRIINAIGAGGMGQVYLAHDTRLDRQIALKILPPELDDDRDRRTRFTREAKAVAALNHPNIVTVYSVEEAEGQHFITMELVQGRTLAELLPRDGFTVSRFLQIAIPLTDAIAAAHQAGITHRDVKSANVMVSDEGRVKVLDFGLAKVQLEMWSGDGTPATPTSTEVGHIAGTPYYMSPEQAEGKRVDARSDIFSLGVVFYEMLVGERPFVGDSTTAILSSILTSTPRRLGALRPTIPARLTRHVHRCIEKRPLDRYQSATDLRHDLEEISLAGNEPEEPKPGSGSSAGLGFASVAGIAALAAALGGAGTWGMFAPQRRAPEVSRIVRLTDGPLLEFAPAISPDRKWFAYVAASPSGRTDVWVRFVGGSDAINLTASADLDITANTVIGGLAIAPEGNRIAVMAKRRDSPGNFSTWEVPAPLPGVPRRLLDDGLLGVRWSADGRRISFIRAGSSAGDALWVADADGTNRQEIIPAAGGIHIHWPVWSDDGYVYFNRTRSTVANLDQSDIYRVRAEGGAPEPVVTAPRRAMFPMVAPGNGGVFFASDAASADLNLYWRPPGGTPVARITHGIGDYSAPSLSADGRAIVATYGELRQSIVRLTTTGAGIDEQPITQGYSGDLDPTISAHTDRLVFSSSRSGNRWIWSSQLDGSHPRPLTSGDVLDQWPSISPDGSTVAFVSDRGGRRGIWLISSEGGSPRHLVNAESIGGLSWTPDGAFVLYAAEHERWPGLFMVAVADGKVQRLPTDGAATDPACSPLDGVVAYVSPRTTGTSFSELRFVDLKGNVRFSKLPKAPPIPAGFANGVLAWSPDGRRLAIVSQNANAPVSIWLIEPAAAQPQFQQLIELPPAPRVRGIAWTPDGRSLVIGKHDVASDIVLIELKR